MFWGGVSLLTSSKAWLKMEILPCQFSGCVVIWGTNFMHFKISFDRCPFLYGNKHIFGDVKNSLQRHQDAGVADQCQDKDQRLDGHLHARQTLIAHVQWRHRPADVGLVSRRRGGSCDVINVINDVIVVHSKDAVVVVEHSSEFLALVEGFLSAREINWSVKWVVKAVSSVII